MRSHRFFKDNPANFMRAAQALFLFIPLAWGLSDAAKGDADNAVLKLMWFMLMLGSYLNGYLLGDSNTRRNVVCNRHHYQNKCDLPHFPADAQFSDNPMPVEGKPKTAMEAFLEEHEKPMKDEYKREIERQKQKDTEPGFQEEGREDSKQFKM